MNLSGSTTYPVAINVALLILRIYLGLMIFTHGYRKVFRGGRLAGTARWFDSIGMKSGKLNAHLAASTEIGTGVALAFGLLTPFAAASLMALMLVAIVTVHFKNGFMITNPGGGIEYCLGLTVIALLLGTEGAGRYSLDYAWGVFSNWSHVTDLLVTLLVGVGAAIAQLLSFYRPQKEAPT